MKEEFLLPELTDEEFEWLAIALSVIKPARAVELFINEFDRWMELDEDIVVVKKALRQKCYDQKHKEGSRLYKQIRDNKAMLEGFERKLCGIYSVFNKYEYWTFLQECYVGIHDGMELQERKEKKQDLKEASKIAAAEFTVQMAEQSEDNQSDSDSGFDIEMETPR